MNTPPPPYSLRIAGYMCPPSPVSTLSNPDHLGPLRPTTRFYRPTNRDTMAICGSPRRRQTSAPAPPKYRQTLAQELANHYHVHHPTLPPPDASAIPPCKPLTEAALEEHDSNPLPVFADLTAAPWTPSRRRARREVRFRVVAEEEERMLPGTPRLTEAALRAHDERFPGCGGLVPWSGSAGATMGARHVVDAEGSRRTADTEAWGGDR